MSSWSRMSQNVVKLLISLSCMVILISTLGCPVPSALCTTDTDCASDGDICTDEVCDTTAGTCSSVTNAACDGADSTRGGLLYDKWWAVTGATAPTTDHARWALQSTNTRSGADTWRCKECHGWDYKGSAGAYNSDSSHFTGFTGIRGTTLGAQDVFDTLKTAHGFGAAGLADSDIWDLAMFVLEGTIDTDTIIDANGAFTGTVATGQTLYDDGIGSNIACAVCHGADGLTIEFHAGEFLGTLADDNPWEFQHKMRFGQPDTAMPSSISGGGTTQDVADLGAYAQTLP